MVEKGMNKVICSKEGVEKHQKMIWHRKCYMLIDRAKARNRKGKNL